MNAPYPFLLVIIWCSFLPTNLGAQNSVTATEFYQKAVELHEQEDFSHAIDYYSEAIALDEKHTSALYNRSLAYFEMEKYRQALLDIEDILATNPADIEAYEQRGRIKFMLMDNEGAVADYSEVINKQLTPFTLINRGQAMARLQDYNGAIKDFEAVLRINPKDTEALVGLGDLWFNLADYDLAADYYSEALEYDPYDERIYNNRANAWVKMDSIKAALMDYDAAVNIHPNSHILTNRAFLHVANQNFEIAKSDALTASRLDYQNDQALYILSQVFQQSNDYDRALANIDQAITINPGSALYFNQRGNLFQLLGADTLAIADLEMANALEQLVENEESSSSQNVFPITDTPKSMAEQSQYDQLIPRSGKIMYNQNQPVALATDPEMDSTRKKFPSVIPKYYGSEANYLKIKEKKIENLLVKTDQMANSGNIFGALEAQNEAIELDANQAMYYTNRAQIKQRIGDQTGVLADCDRALQLDHHSAKAWFFKGKDAYNALDYATAVEYLNKAIHLSEDKNGQYYHQRGLAKHKTKDHYGACMDWESGAKYQNETAQRYYNLRCR